MGRDRKKPLFEHYTAIPLCPEHHLAFYPESIHRLGISRFNALHNIDVWQEAFKLITKYMELV